MAIPNKIKIGGIIYTIKLTPEVLHIDETDKKYNGYIDFCEGVINICTNHIQEQTFWHEVLHGIFEDRQIDVGKREEAIIDTLAAGLLALMVDNPILFPGQRGKVVDCVSSKQIN